MTYIEFTKLKINDLILYSNTIGIVIHKISFTRDDRIYVTLRYVNTDLEVTLEASKLKVIDDPTIAKLLYL